MNRTRHATLLALLLALLSACSHSDHSHDGEVPEERATVSVTRWTDRSELFLEYPLLVAGKNSRSAIHLTNLTDFSPLSDGEAIVTLEAQDGRRLEFRDGPSRPGIFGVDLKVDRPGKYSMSLRVDTPDLQDVHGLGTVTVHAPGDRLPHAHDAESEISFLKEQQWTLDFGTATAIERGIQSSIIVPATIEPRPGSEALLASVVSGRINPTPGVPVPGTRVRSGALLAQIVPRSSESGDGVGLRAALIEAEQAHGLALKERDRARRLVEARALPQRRLDEAEAALTASAARLEAADARRRRFESLSQSTRYEATTEMFALRAPFDGVISDVHFSAGVSVEANEPLMRILDPDRVHVVGAVPEAFAMDLESVTAGELNLDGRPPLNLGAPLNVSPVIDPIARTVEVRFALDNRGARLRVGQTPRLRLLSGEKQAVTAIPESAVVVDAGRPVVFVQTGGESFERRPVRLGNASEGYVHVITGVERGERVVHRGAYLVRLATWSTQTPAHGHVH